MQVSDLVAVCGPASLTGRRPAFYRGAYTFLLGFALLFGFTGCQSAPEAPRLQTQRIERVARGAVRLLDQGSPLEARALERDIARAVEVTTREFHRPFWDRSESAADHAWQRVARAATEATRRHKTQTLAAQEEWRDLAARVTVDLQAVRSQAGGASWTRQQATDFQYAESYFRTARELASGGAYQRAIETAVKADNYAKKVAKSWDAVFDRFHQQDLLRQWRGWANETVERSRSEGTTILVDKLRRKVELYVNGRLIESFDAELGAHGLRQKYYAGDMATPEGRYRVTELKSGGSTKYYKALLINYPNAEDLERHHAARRQGLVPRGRGAGSLIEIHGHGGRGEDWTEGCVALSNKDMDRLFARVRRGTPVTIVGTR